MVWNTHTKTHTKLLVDKREHAMGFRTGITTASSLFEGQQRFMLGQAMDLNTMVWTIGLRLTL